MKAGFLGGGGGGGQQKQPGRNSKPTPGVKHQTYASSPHAACQPATTHPPQPQPGGTDAAPLPDAGSWAQCMELLKSGSDERKFVGLLLVTKLLPHGSDAAVQSVLEAVGWPFLQRMLLPLRQQQQQQLPEDELQQQQLSASLGLSIISAAARLQEVAGSEELLQLTPLLSRVAAAGGVAPVFLQQQQQQQQQDCRSGVDRAADLAAAVDALECLVACASSGSYQRSVLLESNCFPSAAAAMAAALAARQHCQQSTATSTRSSSSSSSSSSRSNPQEAAAAGAAAEDAAARAVMLSMQLMGVLLTGSDEGSRGAVVQAHPTAAAAAIMLLAAVFGGQAASQPPAGKQQQQQQQAGWAAADAAALQLEALHTLLLLLPLAEGAAVTQRVLSVAAVMLAAEGPAAGAAAAAGGAQESVSGNKALLATAVSAAGDWPSALRRGLVQVLRGRVGAVQRHSALQLAAAAVELLGPAWLLPQQQQSEQPATSSSSSGKPEEFLLVLMEVLVIEAPLLLSDAVNPGAAVPKADAAMAAAAAAGAGHTAGSDLPKAASSEEGSEGDVDMAEASEAAAAAAAQTVTVRQMVEQQLKQHEQQQGAEQQQGGEQQQQQQQQQQPGSSDWAGPPGFQQQQKPKPLRQQLAELQLPEDKPIGQGQQQAGARALQCLPSCYTLLEACLEVLVSQVSCLEDLADLSSPAEPQQHQDTTAAAAVAGGGNGVGPGGVVGGRAVSWQDVLPVLGIKEVEQLMTRMGQVTEVVCEFLDYATSPRPTPAPPPAAAAGEPGERLSPVDPWLVVGAVRLLGRFLADAPDVHAAAVRKLLPRLLLPQGRSASAAVHGTIKRADGEPAQQQQQQQQDSALGVVGGLPEPVVSFLLPAMLAWTSQHSTHHQDWASFLLQPDSGCVAALAAYAAQMAAAALGARSRASSSRADGCGGSDCDWAVDAVAEQEVQLGSVCQVLYQLLSSQAVLLSARAQQQPGQQRGVLLALLPAQSGSLAAMLDRLCSWACGVWQQQAECVQEGAAQLPDEPVAAARAVLLRLQPHQHSTVGVRLSTLMPAAALAGQVLGMGVETPSAASAAELLCWGCQVGWCVQLTAAIQQEASRQQQVLVDEQAVLQHMLQVWEVAELEEVWEACLQSAAELLTQHGPGSVFGRALRCAARADHGWWLKHAKQAAGDDAAAAVVDASMGVQLLLQAVGTC